MKTIEIKDIDGKILYSYTCENNNISKTLEQASIEKISLNYANLSGKLIENIILIDLDLNEANFTNSIFENVIINNSKLNSVNLQRTEIKNTQFIHTAFNNSNFTNSFIKNSQFSECILSGSLFFDTDIVNSEFKSKHMRNINFMGTLFDNVNYQDNIIKNSYDVACIGNIGSRCSCTNVFNTDKGILVQCGCFFGTLKEFKKEVLITHKNNFQHKKDYLDMINYIQKRFKPKFSLKNIFKINK